MAKKQENRPLYSSIVSIRLTKSERDAWLAFSDKMGMSGNRFFAKAITEYMNLINQPAGHPIKLPPFLQYCRNIMHGGDAFFKE
ncbi:MAG: hypothetical protein EBR82_50990 [Caulobacteraceae bacterium]|nr:hypothetical protein [Caulobacteraceae bacterium]